MAADPNYVVPTVAPETARRGSIQATNLAATSGKLGMPRVLWEGGYLWKFPYNTSGVPKRKFVQIKTASGKTKKDHPVVYEPLTLLYLDPEKQVRQERPLREVVSPLYVNREIMITQGKYVC